jgi:aspartate/tyrosine/aromatic aminotransferase
MFESVPGVPPDPIFSLVAQFRNDPRPDKVNLTVGTWKDEHGRTPVMACVKQAEARLLETETTKDYLGIGGLQDFNQQIARLLLGEESPVIAEQRYVTIQTPGGTGALRVAGEYLNQLRPDNRLWMGMPTWANHANVFSQARVAIREYDYLNPHTRTELDFDSLVEALDNCDEGDAFLFHACCHNPSGFDLAVDQWEIVFGFVRERNLLPIFDCAYQGFHQDVQSDVLPLRRLADLGCEFLICSSNSKNFGLYAERVGAITGIAKSPEQADRLGQYLMSRIRALYSNPPKHGGGIVATVLGDPALRESWLAELKIMRHRTSEMRKLLKTQLRETLGDGHFDFLAQQNGMFSFTGLQPAETDRLREEFAIYMLRSGRINVAGVTPENVQRICEAIATVRQSRSARQTV